MDRHAHRRWFQLSLRTLFLLTLLVATFFAGYSLATRQAEAERRRAEEEARLKAGAVLPRPNDWTGTAASSKVTIDMAPGIERR